MPGTLSLIRPDPAQEAALAADAELAEAFGREDYGPPDGRPEDWLKDPYDPTFEGRVLRNPADDEHWDALFPDHPLSRCRRHLRMLAERLSWKDDVKAAPAS